MASERIFVSVLWRLVLLLSILPVVRAASTTDGILAGLVAAAVVAFLLFIVFVAVFAMAISWNKWYPAIQRSKGRVRMSKQYWRKKKEAKQRLLMNTSRATASTALAQENGDMNFYATQLNRAKDTASWVQGWNDANAVLDPEYEDLTLTMDLDDEKEEPDFCIETAVVDNETLNIGPFKSTEDDATYASVIRRTRPDQTPTASPPAPAPAKTATTVTDIQTVTVQVDDSDDDKSEDLPSAPRKSFYELPLMEKTRQLSSSDTPPPPREESYSDFLKSSMVAF